MSKMFSKRSSVINLIYSGQQQFSYIGWKNFFWYNHTSLFDIAVGEEEGKVL